MAQLPPHVHRGAGRAAPHRLQLNVANALEVKPSVLAFEREQRAGDRLLGETSGVAFPDRVQQKARVGGEQIGDAFVKLPLLGDRGGPADHAVVLVLQCLAD